MRGTNYIPYRDLPAAAFEIPGVRVTKSGRVFVPWHARGLVDALGYTGGYKTIPGKRIQTPIAYADDPIMEHRLVSDQTRAGATPAQREDFKRVLLTSGGILDWPTGAGKTLIGLAFATAFGPSSAGGRALVVAPSTTTEQWRRQSARWLDPSVRVGIVTQGAPTIRPDRRVTWEIEDDVRPKLAERLRRAGVPETLLFRSRWDDDEVTPEERTALRAVRCRRVEDKAWYHVDDLNTRIAGPFADKREAEEAQRTWTPGDYDVLVVGWGLMAQDAVMEALLKWDPKVFVVDEAHRAGKGGSLWRRIERKGDGDGEGRDESGTAGDKYEKKTTAAANLHTISGACAAAVLLMTATPQGDVPRNWHALLDIYDPYSWGSYHKFCIRYAAGHQGKFGMVYDGLSNPEELRERLRHFWVYRSKAETHKGLPAVRRDFIEIDLRDVGRGGIDLKGIRDELKDAEAGGSHVAMQIAVATEQKIPWVKDRILEDLRSGHKVFVWVALRANARTLRAALGSGIPDDVPVFMGDGNLSSAERVAMVEEFVTGRRSGAAASDLRSDDRAAIMIGTLGAFGEAIDGLQHIDVAYVLTLPWTPQQLIQGPEGRHSRVGGTRSVLLKYVRLLGTIDDVLWSRLGEKLNMVAEVREDNDARMLGGEIKGDSPEAEARSLAALVTVLDEWEQAEGAWKEQAAVDAYYERD